ncbi:MAG: hypothetical protein JW795_19015 [Chitinivibrionales bacterium]|nr:hypothetical protein [Chitinivibrionales bacterium]
MSDYVLKIDSMTSHKKVLICEPFATNLRGNSRLTGHGQVSVFTKPIITFNNSEKLFLSASIPNHRFSLKFCIWHEICI